MFPLSSKNKIHMHGRTAEYKLYNFPDSTHKLNAKVKECCSTVSRVEETYRNVLFH